MRYMGQPSDGFYCRGCLLKFEDYSQNFCATLKFVDRHKFSCPMSFSNISRTDHDRFAAERDHLSGLGAECDGADSFPVSFSINLIKGDSARFQNLIGTVRIDLAFEARIFLCLFLNCTSEKI